MVDTSKWLVQELGTTCSDLVLLDCRGSHEFTELHIRNAVNLSVPTIMLRRLAAGKIELVSTIKCRELKARISAAYKQSTFVLYAEPEQEETLNLLARRLKQDGCQVVILLEGFSWFRAHYPEWCESDSADAATPLLGLRSLRISSSCSSASSSSSEDAERCDSSLGLDEDRDFPVEILPFLFLGNAANSEDSEALQRHHIQYVLNVTHDLPNVFEAEGKIHYMQIPIADHWSQDLGAFFPSAIQFIDEARDKQVGVLVHCLAGVSRSVTITLAYLMYKLSLPLNDAFNVVRSRKSNVAPNFNFMEQLHCFEQQLRSGTPLLSTPTTTSSRVGISSTAVQRCSCTNTDCTCPTPNPHFLSPLLPTGASPDSGIEFDRWTSIPE